MTTIELILSFVVFFMTTTSIIVIIKLSQAVGQVEALRARVADLDEAANASYVKFLSESRDWAYEYIEELQNALTIFSKKIEEQLFYFNTYGKRTQSPHTIMLEEIDSAYEELRKLMPEEKQGE